MAESSPGKTVAALDERPCIVIDTNVLLDIWVYSDPATPALLQALERKQLRWLVSAPMREELQRVLDYAHIAKRRVKDDCSVHSVMHAFDRLSVPVAEAPRSAFVCKDPDDQKFIDLAVAHTATLLSKDKLVLKLGKRLRAAGVKTLAAWSGMPEC